MSTVPIEFNDPSDNIRIAAHILRSANTHNLNLETSNNLIFNTNNFKLNENNLELGTSATTEDVRFIAVNKDIIYEVSGTDAKILLKSNGRTVNLTDTLIDLSTIYITQKEVGDNDVLTISASDWSLNIPSNSLAGYTNKNYLLNLGLDNIDISNNITVLNGQSNVKSLHATQAQFTNLDVSNDLYVNNNVNISNELMIGNSRIYIRNNELVIKPPNNDNTVAIYGDIYATTITGVGIHYYIPIAGEAERLILANEIAVENKENANGAGLAVGDNSFTTFLYNSNENEWESNVDFRVAGDLTISGNVTAPQFEGDLSGNAATAEKFTGGTITISGDASPSSLFEGNENIELPFTMPQITLGAHTSGEYMTNLVQSSDTNSSTYLTVDANGRSRQINLQPNVQNGSMVVRDGSGNIEFNATIDAISIILNNMASEIKVDNTPITNETKLIDLITTSDQKLPVTKNTYTFVLHTTETPLNSKLIYDMIPTMQDLSDSYCINVPLKSNDSAVYLEFKIHYVCSYESEQTISFFIHRDPPKEDDNSVIFQDLSMGSNMGIISTNIYNGIYIDDDNAKGTDPKYYLKYKLSSESAGDTIDVSSGILGNDDGYQNFIMAQELYKS